MPTTSRRLKPPRTSRTALISDRLISDRQTGYGWSGRCRVKYCGEGSSERIVIYAYVGKARAPEDAHARLLRGHQEPCAVRRHCERHYAAVARCCHLLLRRWARKSTSRARSERTPSQTSRGSVRVAVPGRLHRSDLTNHMTFIRRSRGFEGLRFGLLLGLGGHGAAEGVRAAPSPSGLYK